MKLINKSLCTLATTLWASQLIASPWPTGIGDKVSLVQNWTISIPVLDNDIGDNLEISDFNTTSVAWGSITLSEDKKSLNYKPRNNFVGMDEFWYVLKDDQGRTNAAKVVAEVVSSVWPEANADSVDATYDEVVKIPVLDNDIGTNLKVISVNEWSVNQGKAWISSNNEISYQQYGEARGEQQDEFWYVFEDQWGRKNSAKVIVSLTESQSSPWPVAVPESATASQGLRVNIPALFNDTGEGLRITKSNEWTANGGKTRIFGNYIRYTPPTNYAGEDHFWYDIIDDQGRTNSTKIDVQVTQNTEKSVVEFCGNTYETDGTLANTQLSSLSPATPVTYPSTEIPDSEVEGELGTINGRRYYIETSGTLQTLKMDVDGDISTVSSTDSELSTYAIATYKGVIYFVQSGRYLLAHDGNKLTELGDILLKLGAGNFASYPYTPDDSEYINTVTRLESDGDALFLSITNRFTTTSAPPSTRVTYLRISDDLDWRPVRLETVAPYSYSGISTTIRLDDFYYFNGIDYYGYFSNISTPNNSIYNLSVKRADNSTNFIGVDGNVEKFIEDRGRLFAITQFFDNAYLSTPYESKLFVVNNDTDEFVELATCEQQ